MSRILPVFVLLVTAALVVLGVAMPSDTSKHLGIMAGKGILGEDVSTPEGAVKTMLADMRRRDYPRAYGRLANRSEVDFATFIRDLRGTNKSLRTYSNLESFDTHLQRTGPEEATVRATTRWATAVGPILDERDLKVVRAGSEWKVIWPAWREKKVPPQVIPVNYLRWDIVYRGAEDDWGAQNVDTPRVRIVSMNAVESRDGVVVMGELVNEDTIPAFVDVHAYLLDDAKKTIAHEASFDKMAHTLLPGAVSPYRIDFPKLKLAQVKSVRMDAKALLVPASADPVIAATNQRLETDNQGRRVLRGELVNQSGQVVEIPQVLVTYYDQNGKIIWVADGYVDRALLPQTPESFQVEVPDDLADRVQTYRVVVNHYSHQDS